MSRHDAIFINMVLKSENDEWLHSGVLPQMLDVSVRPVFTFITSHYSRFGKVPSRNEVRSQFANFKFLKETEPLKYYVEQIRKSYRMAKLRGFLTDISESFSKDDLDESLAHLRQTYSDLLGADSGCFGSHNYADALRDAPNQVFTQRCLVADIPFGDKLLDSEFSGMEKGDWALIAGAPAGGKSWLLFKWLNELWKVHKLNVLLVSCELNEKIVDRRLHAINMRVNYKEFRKGRFSQEQKDVLTKASKIKRKSRFDIICANDHDKSEGKFGSVESIRALIQRYKPDVVGVDGIYLGTDMDEWSKTANFANQFHLMLQEMQVPAIATSQLRNVADPANPKLGDLAFSSAFQQATDFVFLIGKSDELRQQKKATLTVAKAREDEDCKSYMVRFNPGAEIHLERMDKQFMNPLLVKEKKAVKKTK